jgi:hypothetical protein
MLTRSCPSLQKASIAQLLDMVVLASLGLGLSSDLGSFCFRVEPQYLPTRDFQALGCTTVLDKNCIMYECMIASMAERITQTPNDISSGWKRSKLVKPPRSRLLSYVEEFTKETIPWHVHVVVNSIRVYTHLLFQQHISPRFPYQKTSQQIKIHISLSFPYLDIARSTNVEKKLPHYA